jgi:hypothetical protein
MHTDTDGAELNGRPGIKLADPFRVICIRVHRCPSVVSLPLQPDEVRKSKFKTLSADPSAGGRVVAAQYIRNAGQRPRATVGLSSRWYPCPFVSIRGSNSVSGT